MKNIVLLTLWIFNVLFEDEEGNIYVSADKEGIYKIKFKNFR